MAILEEIEQQAKIYAQQREKLAEIVTALNDGMEALKRSHMTRLKNAVNRAAEAGRVVQVKPPLQGLDAFGGHVRLLFPSARELTLPPGYLILPRFRT